jgi:uncharacterized membrane protein (Fun14 family)
LTWLGMILVLLGCALLVVRWMARTGKIKIQNI